MEHRCSPALMRYFCSVFLVPLLFAVAIIVALLFPLFWFFLLFGLLRSRCYVVARLFPHLLVTVALRVVYWFALLVVVVRYRYVTLFVRCCCRCRLHAFVHGCAVEPLLLSFRYPLFAGSFAIPFVVGLLLPLFTVVCCSFVLLLRFAMPFCYVYVCWLLLLPLRCVWIAVRSLLLVGCCSLYVR